MTTEEITTKTPEQRRVAMAKAIQTEVAGGARVESQSDYQAVTVSGHRVNHLLHFVIGLVTFGLWWIGWVIIAVTGGEKRRMVTVDEFGGVSVQHV